MSGIHGIREGAQAKVLRQCHIKIRNKRPKISPQQVLWEVYSLLLTQCFGGRTATDFFMFKLQVAGTSHKGCKDVGILTFHLRSFHLKPNLFLTHACHLCLIHTHWEAESQGPAPALFTCSCEQRKAASHVHTESAALTPASSWSFRKGNVYTQCHWDFTILSTNALTSEIYTWKGLAADRTVTFSYSIFFSD